MSMRYVLVSAILCVLGFLQPLAAQQGQSCIVVLSVHKGDQKALVDFLKAERTRLGFSNKELPIGEAVWDVPQHRAIIEKSLHLTREQLPMATTGTVDQALLPTQANRNCPPLQLETRVVASYLLNEWARRSGRPAIPFVYGKDGSDKPAGESTNAVDGSTLVKVPAGGCWVGSTEGELAELPPHKVVLPEFLIGKTEVTVGQFARFVEATGYKTEPESKGFGFVWNVDSWQRVPGANWRNPDGKGPSPNDFPVRQVTLADAEAYCQWAGLRLPTEEEWERAARGSAGRQYPWGNTWDKTRVTFGPEGLKAVGSHPSGASACGALDLAGSVREWTGTEYQTYSPLVVMADARPGRRQAVRGGSWAEPNPSTLRGAYRYTSQPAVSGDLIGFRVAADAGTLGMERHRERQRGSLGTHARHPPPKVELELQPRGRHSRG